MADVSAIMLPNGDTYNLKDAAERIITTETPNSVGSAVVGEARTGIPNYTPSGDIILQTQNIQIPTTGEFEYEVQNGYLVFNTISLNTQSVAVPTKATFSGSGTNLVTNRVEEE